MINENYQRITEITKEVCTPKRSELILEFLEMIKKSLLRAPASSSKTKHDAEEGGLMAHILQLHDHLVKLAKPYQEEFPTLLNPQNLWCVALLHDIRKACSAAGEDFYIDNVLKSTKISKDKPFKINDAYLKVEDSYIQDQNTPSLIRQIAALSKYVRQFPDGACSLSLIEVLEPELLSDISEPERNAILWHDGGYGDAKYMANGKEGILSILTHAADMLASRWNRITAEELNESSGSTNSEGAEPTDSEDQT